MADAGDLLTPASPDEAISTFGGTARFEAMTDELA